MALWWGEFPWGVPRPYAWPPVSTFLGTVDDPARVVDNTRFEWEQWVKQALSTLLARTAAPVTVTETADTAAASRPLSVFRSAPELVAEAMRKKWAHGIPPKGMGWKEADRILKPYGGVRSKATFYRARAVNLARLAARRSQG